jgi:hyaluronan synthase
MIEFLKYAFFYLLCMSFIFIYPFSIFYGYNIFFGVIVLFYFVIQTYYATMNYRLCRRLTLPDDPPSVALLIVGYRENEVYWEDCLKSILLTTYTNISSVMAFVDGNEEDDRYMADIFQRVMLDDRFFSYVRLCEHKGKRHMLEQGYRYIKEKFPDNDYIIVIDSDTIIEPNGVEELVKCIHADKMNACATGNIQIFNLDTLLAKIINSRYIYAFTIERSAQAYVGVMTCCSGPFSIYRQEYITDDFLEQFIQDTFCGVPVAAGDDRMQTNLLLGKGYYSRQTPLAIATTETPDKLPRYIMQQARWSRSTIRCLSHQVRAIGKQHFYLAIVTMYETLFPFLVMVSFIPTFNIVNQNNNHIFFQRMGIAVAVLVVRTLILMGFNNMDFFKCVYNMFIFPLYFIFLLPVKIYAWSTPWVQNWMTSSRKTIFSKLSLDSFLIYLSIVVWNTVLVLCLYFKFSDRTLFYPLTQTHSEGNKS